MTTHTRCLLSALLAAYAVSCAAAPVTLTQSSQGRSNNITSSGSTFTHAFVLPDDHSLDAALLSLSFMVSQNAAAQNDIISLHFGDHMHASGVASSFSVTNLDVSDFVDAVAGMLTFTLYRNASIGGGNIKLASSRLELNATPIADDPDSAIDDPPQQPAQLVVPEASALALVGLGLLGIVMVRRRTV